MIDQAERIEAGTEIRAEVCVVGAGPAGIALSLALAEAGHQVLLLEAGRWRRDAQAQSLYEGELANALHSPPERFRMRGLGGSSTRWGGRCMPLDPIDFEAREWVADSGWPIGFDDLQAHYRAASPWVEAGPFAYDAREVFAHSPPMIAGFRSAVLCTHSLERFSCPTDFGRRYAPRLAASRQVQVLQGAVCTGLGLAASGRAIETLRVRSLRGGQGLTVRARLVALAMGAIETARLLLASRDVAPQGVGNDHDQVGRRYMCHIAANVGTLTFSGLPSDIRHGYERSAEGVYCRRRLSLSQACQREHRLLNAVARLHFPCVTDPAHGSGVLSGLVLARRLLSYEYGRRAQGEALPLRRLLGHMANVWRDRADTTAFLRHWLVHRTLAARKFPSVILPNHGNRFSLELQGEQVPDPDSRVTLGSKRDALGLPCVRIDWRYQAQDIDSLSRTLALMGAELARQGAGRLEVAHESLEQDLLRYGAYGGHHLGTARMGNDPRRSVVDADARVHGVDNLFITGGAVFPTCGQANPTLTIVALALRLAAHLARRLQPSLRLLTASAARAPLPDPS